jgi:hypothetical protein
MQPGKPMDLEQALVTLRLVDDVFAEHNVLFTLAAGTLLGAVREGKFMGWDYDTDLSCSDEDSHKIPALAESFNARGVSVYYSEAFRCLAVYHEGVTVDIDFWRDDGQNRTMPLRFALNGLGKMIYFAEWVLLHRGTGGVAMSIKNKIKFARMRYILCNATDLLPFALRGAVAKGIRQLARLTGNPRGVVSVPSAFYSTYRKVPFNGAEYWAPGDAEGYLAHRYGDDWRIPQKGWVYYDEKGTIFSASQVPHGDWAFRKFSKA